MDTTKTITHVSLCAGYGGIDLGLGRAIPNLRTIAFSEIEAFACANLVSKMEAGLLDAAPIWTDLKTFPWAEFCDRVDILSGGYPCQPFSAAGKRLGKEDPRHLWPWIADGIASMRPRIVFFENVEGHISLGLREVIEDLERLGYKATWGIFSAREVGAPHQRKRVFILAYRKSKRGFLQDQWINSSEQLLVGNGQTRRAWPSCPGQPQHQWEPPRVVGDTDSRRLSPSINPRGSKEAHCRGQDDTKQANGSAVGDSTNDGSHQRDKKTRGKEQSSKSRRMLQFDGAGSQLGDSKYDGSYGTQITGCDSKNGNNSQSGTVDAVQSEGAGRSSIGKDLPIQENRGGDCRSLWESDGQTQPSMGGDSDGDTDWMDYAELFVTSDNRTDELRLLGNGVVPATAERAFLTLYNQLINEKP